MLNLDTYLIHLLLYVPGRKINMKEKEAREDFINTVCSEGTCQCIQ